MMDLARQQTALLSLLKSGQSGDCDPYVQTVANSAHLVMLREIILAWRFFDIQRHCRLTASLLKKHGNFESAVKSFAATPSLSPFPDKLAEVFLRQMSEHDDPLVACVAQFELYLTKVKLGDTGEYTIDWPTDPVKLITSLTQDGPVDPLTANEPHRMRIARRYPGLVQVSAAESHGEPLGSDVQVMTDGVRCDQIDHESDQPVRHAEKI
jgi:hypothetical protein